MLPRWLPKFTVEHNGREFVLVSWGECTQAQQEAAVSSTRGRWMVESVFRPNVFDDFMKRRQLVSMVTELHLMSGAGGFWDVSSHDLCDVVCQAVGDGRVLVVEKRHFLEEPVAKEERQAKE